LVANHLVLLRTWSRHAAIVNRLGLAQLGVRDDEPDPLGGRFLRSPNGGKLTGVAFEYAAFREMQPLRSLLDAGIPLAFGSDGPNNPYLNIMLASTYPGKPTEAITREQAVIAYTLTSAYAEFAEKVKGSLEPGKFADLAVLSQDIFTIPPQDLPKTESVLTLVGGRVVYDARTVRLQ
jgi:predicted amidohydrolase YtcJ